MIWRKSAIRSLDDLTKHDRSQLRIVPALYNAIAIALPLIGGILTKHILSGIGIAIGALIVAFAGMNGTARKRFRTMLIVTCWLSIATFVGALVGTWTWLTVLLLVMSAFSAGLLTSVSASAAQAGLLTTNAFIIISHTPQDLLHSVYHALFVLAGGLLQILMMWIADLFRQTDVETVTVAGVYASIANYAETRTRSADLQVAANLLEADNVLNDSYMRKNRWQKLRVLANLAELIRMDIVTLIGIIKTDANRSHAKGSDLAMLNLTLAKAANLLRRISGHLQHGEWNEQEDPAAVAELQSVVHDIREVTSASVWSDTHLYLHQLYSKLAQVVDVWNSDVLDEAYVVAYAPRRTLFSQIHSMVLAIRANFTFRSTTFRHAVRLAVTIAVAAILYRTLPITYGYWLPLTTMIILKADFFTTFARGIARVLGTIIGLVIATLLVMVPDTSHVFPTVLIVLFAWAMYTVATFNFALFSLFMTAEIVVLLSFFQSSPAGVTIVDRLFDTVIGSALALFAYLVWPTWQRRNVPTALADLIAADRQYFHAVFQKGADGSGQAQMYRKRARLARTNAVGVIEQFMREPVDQTLDVHAVAGMLTALHRFSDTLLALESRLNNKQVEVFSQPALQAWQSQMEAALARIESLVRNVEHDIDPIDLSSPWVEQKIAHLVPSSYLGLTLNRLEETIGTMKRMLPF